MKNLWIAGVTAKVQFMYFSNRVGGPITRQVIVQTLVTLLCFIFELGALLVS
jgi:hypothetical protein